MFSERARPTRPRCIEMRDSEQPPEALSSPERLMTQVRECAARARVPLLGENALFRSDAEAFDTIILHARLGRCAGDQESD